MKNGSNSDAKDLYSVDSGNGKQVISHKNREFSSTGSLYVHLRKPSETGHLTFVYGLFYHLDKPAYEGKNIGYYNSLNTHLVIFFSKVASSGEGPCHVLHNIVIYFLSYFHHYTD